MVDDFAWRNTLINCAHLATREADTLAIDIHPDSAPEFQTSGITPKCDADFLEKSVGGRFNATVTYFDQ